MGRHLSRSMLTAASASLIQTSETMEPPTVDPGEGYPDLVEELLKLDGRVCAKLVRDVDSRAIRLVVSWDGAEAVLDLVENFALGRIDGRVFAAGAANLPLSSLVVKPARAMRAAVHKSCGWWIVVFELDEFCDGDEVLLEHGPDTPSSRVVLRF